MWLRGRLQLFRQQAEAAGELAVSALAAALGATRPQDQEAVIREAIARLTRVAERYVGNREDALDCAQEALIQSIRNFERFEGRAQVTSWMHRIAVNCALTHLRRQGDREEVPIDDLLPVFDSQDFLDNGFRTNDLSADEILERDDARRQVREAIQCLPETHRAVLILRDIEERPLSEVAELLELTEGAVRVRVHRARSALRQLMAPLLAEGRI
ncbi:MAG: RNA polymerase sigma factor [Minwuia sp.]|uniref:RNA polymerase sigma factor n=1 Tax=Minwuia sp. TaxID=2493630 RepID=UPI003A8BA60D